MRRKASLNPNRSFMLTSFSEIGYEMEKRLFEGAVSLLFRSDNDAARRHRDPDNSFSDLLGVPAIWKRPTKGNVVDYRREGFEISVINKWKLPKADLAWRIYMHYIAYFYDDVCWKLDRNTSPDDFYAEKDVGRFFKMNDNGKWVEEVAKAAPLLVGYRAQPAGRDGEDYDIVKVAGGPECGRVTRAQR